MATSVQEAAQRWREAQHVANEVGGRAAQKELADATKVLKQASGTRR